MKTKVRSVLLTVVLAGALVTTAPSATAKTRAKTATMQYGPIALAPGHLTAFVPNVPKPCSECYVTGVKLDLVYNDGKSANLDTGVMLHHILVWQYGRPDSTCGSDTPIGMAGQRFFASGNERTAGAFPAGYGYHLGSGFNAMNAYFDLMNHSTEMKFVTFRAKVSYLPGDEKGIKRVTPVWLDQNNCSLTSTYKVPAGPSNQVTRWTSTITGTVVAAGGHVHDGGIKTVLSNGTTGEHICTSRAGYGTNPAYKGSVESMSTCIGENVGSVKKGQELAMDTYYDVPEPRDDVMGIMLAYIHDTES
jgi:stress up-regulated protein Nod 19